MGHIQFEIVTTSAGAVSIRDKVTNEIMHNPVGPWIEANTLYIESSDLKGRLSKEAKDDLIIFDIGLGAAANALATLHCVRNLSHQIRRKIHLVSFEKNLELLSFALQNASHFHHFQNYEIAVQSILDHHSWTEENIKWELRYGEFLDLIEKEPLKPHLIFFDPYSPKVNREMWTTECFQKIFRSCRKDDSEGTILYTYSQATPIRSALLAAGFYVGHGPSTGLKEETTQASTHIAHLSSPLGARWFKRWKNSQTPYPYDCENSQQSQLREQILNHFQFA